VAAIDRTRAWLPCLLVCALLGCAGAAPARRESTPRVVFREQRFRTPAEPEPCYSRLSQLGVAFEPVAPAEAMGVSAPLRLLGPLEGVEVVARDPKAARPLLDCRLALVLHRWAKALREAGIDRVEHYSTYRPAARVQGSRKASGHARGLAIDAGRFRLASGEVLDVLTDWEDRERGSPPCPRRAHESRPGRVLRGLVCDAIDDALFQVVITPHHDRAHADHVHLELRPEVSWVYVR
jgi:hypothetical protein